MNLYNALAQGNALTLAEAATRTSDLDGDSIDLLDYEGVGAFLLNCAAAGAGTDPTLDVKLQHSDDDSTFTDVTNGAFTQVTDAASLELLKLNVANLKRYVKVVGTLGGTDTPTFTYSAEFVGFKKAA